MPWELWDGTSRTTLNDTFRPPIYTAGGLGRKRLVRKFGSTDWFVVQDRQPTPAAFVLHGVVSSGWDDAVKTELDGIEAAVLVATRLYMVEDSADEAYLPVNGGPPPIFEPEGNAAHIIRVTLILWPTQNDWIDDASGANVIF